MRDAKLDNLPIQGGGGLVAMLALMIAKAHAEGFACAEKARAQQEAKQSRAASAAAAMASPKMKM